MIAFIVLSPNEQFFPDISDITHGNCLSALRIVSTNEVAMPVMMSDNHRDKQPRRRCGHSLSRTDPQIIADAGY